MRNHYCLLFAIVAVCGSPAPGFAQPNEWSHGTTLNVFASATADPSRDGPGLGGAVGWVVTPRFAIEGTGAWYTAGNAEDAFAGALKAQVAVVRGHRVVPFLQAGVGLYKASFATDASSVPVFYRDRMAARGVGTGAVQSFTDPTVVFGGGVGMILTRHVALRPDVEVTVVTRAGRNQTITAFALHLAYHFEEHPVTPERRR